MANLASMLPSAPKSFGRLSEAYLSAFLALTGKNPLNLPVKQSYALILVDGLGVQNIKNAGAHASFLNRQIATSKRLFSGFPTTTASSLASLATGKNNGEHGLIGYRVFDRSISRAINFLNDLGEDLPPRHYQDLETISELAANSGKRVLTIGPSEYQSSGFTLATMPKAEYLPVQEIVDRLKTAARELANPGVLIYLYIPELDQLAHRFGTESMNWLSLVEELDSDLKKFAKTLPKNAGAILTADHGVIDVDKSEHVYLDEFSSMQDLLMVGGDPRATFLYFDSSISKTEKLEELSLQLSGLCDVATIEDLVKLGWLDRLGAKAAAVAPDFVLIAKGDRVCYHRGFAKVKSLEMVGQHGGMTKAEWEVPLVIF